MSVCGAPGLVRLLEKPFGTTVDQWQQVTRHRFAPERIRFSPPRSGRRHAQRNHLYSFICDPATKAVAPPIYQNVAYEFESADKAATLFNLEIPGFCYSRIANPTTDILEQRVAQLEGGVAALAVASGQAALTYAFLADRGGSIVSTPQLYGTTHAARSHSEAPGHPSAASLRATAQRLSRL